jgi:aryl-alcohol dehydrogenase-like predicted oxidoreductase
MVCLGTMLFGDDTAEDVAERIVAAFVDAGGNFIDTADIYMAGESERMLGRIVNRLGIRNKVLIATKAHNPIGLGPNNWGNSRLHLMRACEDSLKRLNVDCIDLYQLHRPHPDVPIDETLRAVDDLLRAGKIRLAGTSNFGAWRLVEALWASKEIGTARFVSEQPPYNLLDRRIERELLPMAQTYGIAIMPWAPLAGGMLSGKYRQHQEPEKGSRYSPQTYRGAPVSDEVWSALMGLEEVGKERGCTLADLAYAWCASRPGITAPIIGPRTLDHLQRTLQCLTINLTDEEIKRIDKIVVPGTCVKDYYGISQTPNARW